jgi:cysteine desulfurase
MAADVITYLDNNASTRVDPRVVDAMLPLFTSEYGNPSSMHRFGGEVAAKIEQARCAVAAAIGATDAEIVFTSGGTEADNAALRGVITARPERRRIVISAVEHHAIIDTAKILQREAVEIVRICVDRAGQIDFDQLAGAVDENTALVSIMLANNETGVIADVHRVSEIAHRAGALVHTDAVNALGKIAIDVSQLGVDLLSLSAHKIYGPKGVGALYVRAGTPFRAMIVGGPQERHRRGGTLNAAGIVGLGAACALLREDDATRAKVAAWQSRIEQRLLAEIPGCEIIGREAARVPNTTCACFENVSAEPIILLLSEAGICVSSGAACSSGAIEPSHVLRAMNIPPRLSQGQVRISTGRFNTDEDVNRLLDTLPRIVKRAQTAQA